MSAVHVYCTLCEQSAIEKVSLDIGGNFLLPPVSIVQQLLLVVEQLLVSLCGELKVGSLGEGERKRIREWRRREAEWRRQAQRPNKACVHS